MKLLVIFFSQITFDLCTSYKEYLHVETYVCYWMWRTCFETVFMIEQWICNLPYTGLTWSNQNGRHFQISPRDFWPLSPARFALPLVEILHCWWVPVGIVWLARTVDIVGHGVRFGWFHGEILRRFRFWGGIGVESAVELEAMWVATCIVQQVESSQVKTSSFV